MPINPDFWSREIAKAEAVLAKHKADKTLDISDADWYIQIDPEDFLDLMRGKWDMKKETP